MAILKRAVSYGLFFVKCLLFGILAGALGGLVGAAFHHALHSVTHLRQSYGFLIWLLPVGGLLTVALYKIPALKANRGTNEVIDAVLSGKPVSPLVAPGIFVASGLTHLFGGSAGREGAALQMGGSLASFLGKLLRLSKQDRKLLTMSGMSAVFSGLFATPLTACIFTMEFASVGTIFSPALLPCLVAAYTASRVSGLFGVHPEGLLLETVTVLDLGNAWRFFLLAVAVSFLAIFMCWCFHNAEHGAKRLLPNPWVRTALLGAVIAVLTFVVGDQRFNGAGMDLALQAVGGHADWYSFLLKILFTSLTLAAGFKGGEIVPTFCIGATFGCVIGSFLGLDPGISGALGLVGLFCGATNSPIASILLSMELFGSANVLLFALVCVVSFVLSGKSGLYASQVLQFGDPLAEDVSSA